MYDIRDFLVNFEMKIICYYMFLITRVGTTNKLAAGQKKMSNILNNAHRYCQE